MKIGGKEKVLVIYDHKDYFSREESPSVTTSQDRAGIHYIHVIDRSGSMYGNINTLIDNVKQCVNEMRASDLLSVIWFSDHDECETVIKGAKRGPEINKLLDNLKSVESITCFSSPLREIRKVVEDLKVMCPDFMVTFFTDGHPVTTSWSYSEELNKIEKELLEMPENVIALNTVGYGYYNKELLQIMSRASTLGKTFHSHNIREYYEIFQHNQERTLGLTTQKMEFSSSSVEDRILFMSDKDSSLFLNNSTVLTKWSQDRNFVVFICDEAGEVCVDDSVYEVNKLPQLVNATFQDHFLYTLAYELYYAGHARECLDILSQNLRDKRLIDEHLQAFTNRERQAFTDLLCKASFDLESRLYEGVAEPGYVPDANSPCILDWFMILEESEESYYLPEKTSYTRTTKQVKDTDRKFKRGSAEIMAPVSDMIWAKDRLNLTLSYPIDGVVDLDTDEASRVGLPEAIPASEWRAHTFIKDGEPHVSSGTFLVTRETLDKLEEVSQTSSVADNRRTDGLLEIVLNFEDLPVINQSYVKRSLDLNTVFDLTMTTLKLQALQKVVKHYSNEIQENRALTQKESQFQHLTLEQIEVLKNHGLDKELRYSPVSSETKSSKEADYYEVRAFEFQIKGCASLPSIAKLGEKLAKVASGNSRSKLNFVEETMRDYEEELQEKFDFEKPSFETRDLVYKELKEIKRALKKTRASLSCLKMSRVLTGDWWPELVEDDKGNYTWQNGDHVMVAKIARKKRYF